MAFDHANFFKIVGRYSQFTRALDAQIAAFETNKQNVRDEYAGNDLEDLYVGVPSLVTSLQGSLTSMASGLVAHLTNGLLADRDFVTEQLISNQTGTTGVLNALHAYMLANSVSIKKSATTFDGNLNGEEGTYTGSSDEAVSEGLLSIGTSMRLYCSRILDGVNSPDNDVSASLNYVNKASELSINAVVYGKVIDNSTVGSEQISLYTGIPKTGAHLYQEENPGPGPTLTNATGARVGPANNYDFSTSASNLFPGWTLAGGSAGTAWMDDSGTGVGPLKIVTDGVTASQQLVGLSVNKMYFVAANFSFTGDENGGNIVAKLRLRNNADDHNYMGVRTLTVLNDGFTSERHYQVFGFFYLPDTTDLEDVYVEFEADNAADGSAYTRLRKIVVAPAVYYNGVAWAVWSPVVLHPESLSRIPTIGATSRMEVLNDQAGKYQEFFRREYKVQLPSNSSPSISDTDAT